MFEVTARLQVRDGELEGFKRLAAEIMRQSQEHDTKTLRYDWFMSDDGTECEVREAYLDPDGLLEHNTHVRESRDELFRQHAYGHDMTIYAEPSAALAELMERMAGHVAFNRFSFLQGLDRDAAQAGTATFEATARLKLRQGRIEEFKRRAAELLRRMGEEAEPPLRNDWFLRDDETECEVREAYMDADHLLAHQRAVAEPKLMLFREFVEGHTMTFYGELSPALTQALTAMGTPYRRFSFLQGLDTGAELQAGVSA